MTSRAAPSGLKVTYGPKPTPKPAFSGPKAAPKPAADPGAPPKFKKVRFGPTVEDFKSQAPQPPHPPPAELHPHLARSDAESLESDDITDDLLYNAVVAHIAPENTGNPSGSRSL